uniref:Uncharacterized protein n=1 Tax=Meloidogyne javanica TaxID=6303 RepID=A0A915MAV3_MELJA
MRDKAKMLLLPFNLFWLALILASNFDVGDTASNFDEDGVLKESRIKRLEQIAEIDNLTGMPRGGLYQSDSIEFEEYKYLKEHEEYKTLFETFNKAFGRLVNKVVEFAQLNLKNINISLDETEEIANELKKYDEIVKNSKNVGEMLEEGVMIRTVKLVLGQDGVEMLGGLCAMLRVPRGDAGGYERSGG